MHYFDIGIIAAIVILFTNTTILLVEITRAVIAFIKEEKIELTRPAQLIIWLFADEHDRSWVDLIFAWFCSLPIAFCTILVWPLAILALLALLAITIMFIGRYKYRKYKLQKKMNQRGPKRKEEVKTVEDVVKYLNS